jgi:hypothetical protein
MDGREGSKGVHFLGAAAPGGTFRGFDPAAFISHITMRICAPRRSELQAIGIIVRSDSEGRDGREGREGTLKSVGRRP